MNFTPPLVQRTADTRLLVESAVRTARREFRADFNYAKAGVILTSLEPAAHHQGELDLGTEVDLAPAGKDRTSLMDLNRRFGRDSLRIASATLASHDVNVRSWATRHERRLPRFTTRWKEVPSWMTFNR